MFEPFFNSCVCTDSARGSQTSACTVCLHSLLITAITYAVTESTWITQPKLVETGIQTMEESEMALSCRSAKFFYCSLACFSLSETLKVI